MIATMDLGGTNIKLGLFEEEYPARLVWQGSIPALSQAGILRALDAAAEELRGHLPIGGEIHGLGIGMPGIVDIRQNRLCSVNAKFADAVSFDFSAWCRQTFFCELAMDNDANAALLGESTWGAGQGWENMVLMTLGTGIGTAAIMDGHLLRGVHFQAGNMGGHFVADPWGPLCTCGNRGCLESLAGSREIEKRLPILPGYAKSRMGQNGRSDIKALIEARQAGDIFAGHEFDRLMDLYAAGIINLVHAYDPELVILSGGIMQSAQLILPELQARVWKYAWTPWGQVEFAVAAHPNESVLYGVYTLFKEQISERLIDRYEEN